MRELISVTKKEKQQPQAGNEPSPKTFASEEAAATNITLQTVSTVTRQADILLLQKPSMWTSESYQLFSLFFWIQL